MLRDDGKRESFGSSVEKVESNGNGHGGAHGKGNRSGKDAKGEKSRSNNLGSGGTEGPEGRRSRKESEEFSNNIGGESVNILDLVESVVDHEGACSNSEGSDEDIRKRIEDLFLKTRLWGLEGRFWRAVLVSEEGGVQGGGAGLGNDSRGGDLHGSGEGSGGHSDHTGNEDAH